MRISGLLKDTMRVPCFDVHCLVLLNIPVYIVLVDVLLTVKAATLIFISGRGSAIPSAKQGKPGSIYNLVKNKFVVWAAQTRVYFMKILIV